jgi:hypothetical protein
MAFDQFEVSWFVYMSTPSKSKGFDHETSSTPPLHASKLDCGMFVSISALEFGRATFKLSVAEPGRFVREKPKCRKAEIGLLSFDGEDGGDAEFTLNEEEGFDGEAGRRSLPNNFPR